jgi:hypothetical protein
MSNGFREYTQNVRKKIWRFHQKENRIKEHELLTLVLNLFNCFILIANVILWAILAVNDYNAVTEMTRLARHIYRCRISTT